MAKHFGVGVERPQRPDEPSYRGFTKNGPRWPYTTSFNPRSPWAQEGFAATAAAILACAARRDGDEAAFRKYLTEAKVHEAEHARLWAEFQAWDASLECELSCGWDSLFKQTDARLYRGPYQIEGGPLCVSCSLCTGTWETRPWNDDPFPGELPGVAL